MTAAFLQSELTSLISDSKRKHADIRNAAEKSLQDLKAISVTSETQLAGDLIRKQHFLDPFVLACKSQHAKIAGTGAIGLQRLVAATAIPRARLPDVLQAFEAAVSLGLDVQLKILQTLPSLLQLYAEDLHGEALARTLSVSADLSSSKQSIVSSTAGATFQQLVSAVFARAATGNDPASRTSYDEQDTASNSEDAFAVFIDLCALLTEDSPQFVRLEKLPPPSILETLESLLSAHGSIILDDDDCLKACSEYLLPGLEALINNSASFGIVARAIRIVFILVTRHLERVSNAITDTFLVILRILDRAGNQWWKRLLVLEFFRGLCSDFEALRTAYTLFDLRERKSNLVSDFMACLVRIAAEDPSLIGLGRQSTLPSTKSGDSSNEMAAVDIPIGSVAQADTSAAGISTEVSTIATPCLDLFDRTTPPEVPETYIFTLVLGCISSFADGLSKYVMPLSVPARKSSRLEDVQVEAADEDGLRRRPSLRDAPTANKYQHLINPLTRKDIDRHAVVEDCAKLIESCWPAVLATCSTFLNAALDTYYYHMLIRTVQKLTQVSGILELTTPRDALLTTLAKVSVPAQISNLMNTFYGGKVALIPDLEAVAESDDMSIKSPIVSTPRHSVDLTPQTLNVRNLLCIRALLNLGIALGPTLSDAAWTIIMQALEQVDALMTAGPTAGLARGSSNNADLTEGGSATLAGEIAAVDTARRRMLDSTASYPEQAFRQVCQSLFKMIEDVLPAQQTTAKAPSSATMSLRPKASSHKSTRSVSGTWTKAATLEVEVQFVLKTVGRAASVNLHRFRDHESISVSWDLIIANLLSLQSNTRLQPYLRMQATNIVNAIIVEACTVSSDTDEDEIDGNEKTAILLEYGILALRQQLENVRAKRSPAGAPSDIDNKVKQTMLEALHNVVGSRGDDLGPGWSEVIAILSVVSDHGSSAAGNSATLLSSSFKILQLMVSDFLSTLNPLSILGLLDLFQQFGGQQLDLNMALTTVALHWNVGTLVSESVKELTPFSSSSAVASVRILANPEKAKSGSWLWQKTVCSLATLCKDSRTDVRNASERMLGRLVEAAVPHMPPETLDTCCRQVFLPLLQHHTDQANDEDESWQKSALDVLQDLAQVMQNHGQVLLEARKFNDTWQQVMLSTSTLLQARGVHLASSIFDILSDTIESLRQVDNASFKEARDMLSAVWQLWKQYQPATTTTEGSNQNAIDSHLRLWHEMSAWNIQLLADFEDVAEITARIIRASALSARHDQYTTDINRLSSDQEQIVRSLKMFKQITPSKLFHAQLVLDLARDKISQTHNSMSSGPSAKGTRKPTGIALATALVGELRETLQEQATSNTIWHDYPLNSSSALGASLTSTKYGTLPTNTNNPLWQKACLLGIETAKVVAQHADTTNMNLDATGKSLNALLTAIVSAPNLEATPKDKQPPATQILADEQFDINALRSLHESMRNILELSPISPHTRQQCITTLFAHSLVARPWYNDLPKDFETSPLSTFATIRRGSVRAPDLSVRRRISQHATHCLFDYASRTRFEPGATAPPMAALAAPYILLRLSHTLKCFIADQPLRYLQHPHAALQEDLHFTLRSFVELRVIDGAFTDSARILLRNIDNNHDNFDNEKVDIDVSATLKPDGKSHLRLTWNLATRFESLWYKLPRLKKGLAWQEHEHGMGVEECLRQWRDAVSEGWGPGF